MNGKDTLLLVRPNGTLVDVSDLEGNPFLPLFYEIFFLICCNIAWKVFGKVSLLYVFSL